MTGEEWFPFVLVAALAAIAWAGGIIGRWLGRRWARHIGSGADTETS